MNILCTFKFHSNLSRNNFLFRDIAARNCFLNQDSPRNLKAKLGDFGLSRNIYSGVSIQHDLAERIPIRWMPPETLTGSSSAKSDVW